MAMELKVTEANQALLRLVTTAKVRQPDWTFDAFDAPELPISPSSDLASTKTSAAFWSHYIGGNVAAAVTTHEEAAFKRARGIDPDFLVLRGSAEILNVQKKVVGYLKFWQSLATRPFDPYELESCQTALTAATSFDWINHPDLLGTFNSHVGTLSRNYAGLASFRLI